MEVDEGREREGWGLGGMFEEVDISSVRGSGCMAPKFPRLSPAVRCSRSKGMM